MGILSFLSKPLAKITAGRFEREGKMAVEIQENIFKKLLAFGDSTSFGKSHSFKTIRDYQQFKKQIPVRDYEGFSSYISRIQQGEQNVLWPGAPIYFCKTSGTTSGTKYIPITKESMPGHIRSARNALLLYIARTGNASFLDGNLIFLSGSPEMDLGGKIPTGRLSGIVNHHVPAFLRRNQMPSLETNCLEDWEKKIDAIVDETLPKDMRLISGIPPWVQMYFDKLTAKTGKPVGEIFPNFSLFVHGGVNIEPYRKKLELSMGRKVDSLETYPASEGFIAFQDGKIEDGLRLLVNEGIFYEFIPVSEYFSENPIRVSLRDIQIGIQYAIVMTTNAGLWAYSIGDTVKFLSVSPPRLVVTGRIKHFISAFGEHVIAEEVEQAIQTVCRNLKAEIVEFTVAPDVSEGSGKSCHEWFVEFSAAPSDLQRFSTLLDEEMQRRNSYYKDLILGKVLQPLRLNPMKKGTFIAYMKSKGKLGGQNKVPHLGNDRTFANALSEWKI